MTFNTKINSKQIAYRRHIKMKNYCALFIYSGVSILWNLLHNIQTVTIYSTKNWQLHLIRITLTHSLEGDTYLCIWSDK